MNTERFRFPAEWEETIFEILERQDEAAKQFVETAKSLVLRFQTDQKGSRDTPLASDLKAAETMAASLLTAERLLCELLSTNGKPFLLNALNRAQQEAQANGNTQLSGSTTGAVARFRELSGLLRSAATDMVGRHNNLRTGPNKSRPADNLVFDAALYFLGILKEEPTTKKNSKFRRTMEYLLSVADERSKDGRHLTGRLDKTLRHGVRLAKQMFEFYHPPS